MSLKQINGGVPKPRLKTRKIITTNSQEAYEMHENRFSSEMTDVLRQIKMEMEFYESERIQQDYTYLYVKNLDDSITRADLMKCFIGYGNIVKARVISGTATGGADMNQIRRSSCCV